MDANKLALEDLIMGRGPTPSDFSGHVRSQISLCRYYVLCNDNVISWYNMKQTNKLK